MPALMADVNVKGHLRALEAICEEDWHDYWHELNVTRYTFEDFGLPQDSSDAVVWKLCQERGILLLTGNRNEDTEDSLEATIRAHGTLATLPVLTLADAERVLDDRVYAERVAVRLMEILTDIENLRGSGRLYLP